MLIFAIVNTKKKLKLLPSTVSDIERFAVCSEQLYAPVTARGRSLILEPGREFVSVIKCLPT